MRTYSQKLLEKSLGWLKVSDGEKLLYFEFWTLKCIGIVRTMATFIHLICLKVL